ncbi:MAG: hypothetical protein HYT09_00990 [Candidatus Levybacteria bacterium]|nr:hypothetical protein [Candidatus Levybacteria bacterium]
MVEAGSLSAFPKIEEADIDAVAEERMAKGGRFMENLTAMVDQAEPNFLYLLGFRTDPAFYSLGAAYAVAGALTVWRILQEVNPNLPEAIQRDVPKDKLSLASTKYKDENPVLMEFIDQTENDWPGGVGRFFRIGALLAYEMKRRAFERTMKRLN